LLKALSLHHEGRCALLALKLARLFGTTIEEIFSDEA
jgi:hypothetical protein